MPGEFYALFGAMLFGLGHISIRRALDQGWTNQQLLLSVSILNELCFLVGVTWLALAGGLPPLRAEAIGLFLVAGLLTALLGRAALWMSIERIGAARAASYRVTSPVVTVALAYVLLGERLSLGAALGAAVIIGGLWLLTGETRGTEAARRPKGRTERGLLIGIAFGLASSASFGAGQVFRKLGLELTSAPALGSLVGTGVALLVFVVAALRGGQWRATLAAHRALPFWPVLVAGLVTAAAQFMIFYSYERARVSTASVFGATEPVWTFLASSLLMRREEAPTWRLALSILVICGGAALVVNRG